MGYTRNDAFPSKWLKADDLAAGPLHLTIAGVEPDVLKGDDGEKTVYVLHFQNHDKGLVLNQTNWLSIEALHCNDTDLWLGKTIKAYRTKVKFGSGVVDAVRILPPDGGGQPAPKPAAPKRNSAARNQDFAGECKTLFVGDTDAEIGAHISAAMVACDLDGNWRDLSDGDLARVLAALKDSQSGDKPDALAEAGF